MADYLDKLNRKLDDACAGVERDANADAVHELRTSLRRMEAFAAEDLPHRFRAIRKQAGKVRDYDVLAGLTEKMNLEEADRASARRLDDHIRDKREKEALKLAVRVHDAQLSKLMNWEKRHVTLKPMTRKRLLRQFQRVVHDKKFENLGTHNLHEFRLAIKPLRYRAENAKDEDQIKPLREMLRDMQASIGDWHDRMLLEDLAEQVLQGKSSALIEQLRAELQSSYDDCIKQIVRQRRTLLLLGEEKKIKGKKTSGAKAA